MGNDPTPDSRPVPGLYVVGTPIGNRSDLSQRAAQTLGEVDLIACEDTRHAQRLLSPLEIRTSLISYHDHNETERASQIIETIQSGGAVALISDAGMPGISDPGFRIVRACRKKSLEVFAVPGPTALTTALAISGLPTDRFFFLGFLPPKSAARKNCFEQYADFEATLVFYESTHRILKFLDDVIETIGGDRVISVAKELTKLHEFVITASANEVRETFRTRSIKGEFVVMIAKKDFTL